MMMKQTYFEVNANTLLFLKRVKYLPDQSLRSKFPTLKAFRAGSVNRDSDKRRLLISLCGYKVFGIKSFGVRTTDKLSSTIFSSLTYFAGD